jgi:N-dimethylarginine dimethylaminohydrolase
MKLQATNEWDTLRSVVVGTARQMGGTPLLADAYDPKSKHHIKAGTFPMEADCQRELDGLASLLTGMEVKVLRPHVLPGLNQVFTRDVGVVLGDRLLSTRMIEDRSAEWNGIAPLLDGLSPAHRLTPPKGVRVEGGDLMPMDGQLWVGYSTEPDFSSFTTARTNEAAVDWLSDQFPDWSVRGFELQKSDDDPYQNALHLDCCLSVLSGERAIFHPEGFKLTSDVTFLRENFQSNALEVSAEEMFHMQCNLISVTHKDIISCPPFERVNARLTAWGYNVHCTPLQETAKMEGLLRCVTLPLQRG